MRKEGEAALSRYEEISVLLQQPETVADRERYQALMKEAAGLRPVISVYRKIRRAEEARAEAETLLESGDREIRPLAEEQKRDAEAALASLGEDWERLFLPEDPDDGKNVIMEIRAGTGGEEAALFAADLARMYLMAADARHYRTEILSESGTELGGYRELILSVEGKGAFHRLKFESGIHRVQRIPVTDSQGKIQTSAVTVAVLPEADEVDVKIDPGDLRIDVYRASGAGGQHVNKTSSAIRITHLPTGLTAECQDERSQYKNKDRAMKILRSRLLAREKERQDSAIAETRRRQVGSGDRSGRIRTYNFPQGRVTDHRINLTLHQLEAVMNGHLDLITDPLIRDERERKSADRNTP